MYAVGEIDTIESVYLLGDLVSGYMDREGSVPSLQPIFGIDGDSDGSPKDD